MNTSALSGGERAYLLALYLTDGYLRESGKSTHSLEFYFQGNEGGLVLKVAEMLRRTGLNPRLYSPRKRKMILVSVVGKNFLSLFPEKRSLLSYGKNVLRNWINGQGLNGMLGIPFIAGLLDGDGYCQAQYDRQGVFGQARVLWVFSQVRLRFLTEFVNEYINSLRADSAVMYDEKKRRAVRILSLGRDALISAGLSNWSYKVAVCLKKVEEIKRNIVDLKSRFHVAGQVAKSLHVGRNTLVRWCRLGYVKYMRICGAGTGRKKRLGVRYLYLYPR